jgi:hypothetical protein
MRTRHVAVAGLVVLGCVWQAPAETALRNVVSQDRPSTITTVRIEPVDATHVRFVVEGRESWVVDSASFTLVPTPNGFRVIGASGDNTVQLPGRATTFERAEFALSPVGVTGVRFSNEKR